MSLRLSKNLAVTSSFATGKADEGALGAVLNGGANGALGGGPEEEFPSCLYASGVVAEPAAFLGIACELGALGKAGPVEPLIG